MVVDPGKFSVRFTPVREAIIVATAALYVLSLLLPSSSVGPISAGPKETDWLHLLLGCLNGMRGGATWLANAVLWGGVGCLLYSRLRTAAYLGVAATLLGLVTLTAFKWDSRCLGYCVWQASHFVFAGGALYIYQKSRTTLGSGTKQRSQPR